MQFRTTGLVLLVAMVLLASGTAQTTAAPPAITRTVVAATKLPTATDVPLYFKAVSVRRQLPVCACGNGAGKMKRESSVHDRGDQRGHTGHP